MDDRHQSVERAVDRWPIEDAPQPFLDAEQLGAALGRLTEVVVRANLRSRSRCPPPDGQTGRRLAFSGSRRKGCPWSRASSPATTSKSSVRSFAGPNRSPAKSATSPGQSQANVRSRSRSIERSTTASPKTSGSGRTRIVVPVVGVAGAVRTTGDRTAPRANDDGHAPHVHLARLSVWCGRSCGEGGGVGPGCACEVVAEGEDSEDAEDTDEDHRRFEGAGGRRSPGRGRSRGA